MEKSPNSHISNKAMLLAVIAALISLGSLILSFLPSEKPPHTEIASASPSPLTTISPTPKPTRKPKPEPTASPTPKQQQTPEPTIDPALRPEPTPDSPYRHQPTPEFPNDGTVFSLHYSSNQMTFRWHSNTASGAVKYRLRIERKLPLGLGWKYWLVDVDARQNWYVMQFAETGTYRWNMTPMFFDGSLGLPIQWRMFQFVQ